MPSPGKLADPSGWRLHINCTGRLFPLKDSWQPSSPFGVRADHAEAEDGGDFVSVSGLEANGEFLFALDEVRRNGVLDIEEMHGAALFDGLFSDVLAFNQNFKGTLEPLIAVIAHDESHGMRWISWQIERKPFGTPPGRAAHHAVR